jgi:putative nucleotidyltransferase with HDIG domain
LKGGEPMTKRISREECEQLYMIHETPKHVIGHCNAVAHVALEIGRKLNEHGYDFDLALIEGAGLAHDVARVEDEHWNVGAKILRELGFDEVNFPYWIREDGAKMLGNYVMCAANWKIRPRGTILPTSLGDAIVVDTGEFVKDYPNGVDLAVDW